MKRKEKSEIVAKWIKENQGKHFCQCGCGTPMKITREAYYRGVSKRIFAHSRIGKSKDASVSDWIASQQNKHVCKCGCNECIVIRRDHHWRGIPRFINGHKGVHTEEEFWKRVDKKGKDDCWEWIPRNTKNGRGTFKLPGRGKRIYAYRYSFELQNGPIPKGVEICHKCDNPKCVNPDHLFMGTHADNMMDAARKGKMGMKLTIVEVLQIVADVRSGTSKITAATKFGVSKTTIKDIMSGYIWSAVTRIPKNTRNKE